MRVGNFGRMVIPTAFTIADGQSLSDIQDLEGTTLVGIYVPAAWVTAGVTLLASPNGIIVPKPFMSVGVLVTLEVNADFITPILPAEWLSACFKVQIQSGTPDVPVAQTLSSAPIYLLSRVV